MPERNWNAGPGPDGNYGPPCGDGYDSCDRPCDSPQDYFMRQCLPGRLWFDGGYAMWWTKGASIPPLLTTSPDSTAQAQAGVLGQPGTTILVGNEEVNRDLRNGGYMDFGIWLGECRSIALEMSYLGVGKSVEDFDYTSTGSPILARPFFNVESGANDAFLIAYPGVSQGSFAAKAVNVFEGGEALLRWIVCGARDHSYSIEMVAGYRFLRLDDGLAITDAATLTADGSQIQQSDFFNTRNDFNGAELGVTFERHQCRWSLESTLKLGLGNTHSVVAIDGSTITTPANSAPGAPQPGGLLALSSNSGFHQSDRFSVVPELGLTAGYDLTCRWRATLGYTFIYWGGVARPGDQIQLDITPPGTTAPTLRPDFQLHTTDFWAQGLNFGLACHF